MAVSGPNKDLLTLGEGQRFDVYKVNWDTGTYTNVKRINLSGFGNLRTDGWFEADGAYNLLTSSNTVVRINTDPNQPNNAQEYAVTRGVLHYKAFWIKPTSYMLFGAVKANSGSFRLYRGLAYTKDDMKIFTVSNKGMTFA